MKKIIIIGSEKSIVHNYCTHNSLVSLKKFENKFIEKNYDVRYYINSNESTMKNLVKNILSSDEYDGSVILFHQISGYSYFNMIDQKLKDKNIKKILIFNDTHTQRYINHSSMQFFDIMLFNSLTFVKLFYTEYLKKVHIYPFSLGYDFMKEINLNNRNNKILLYGSIGKDVYPLRTTMYNYYKNNKKII